jgi:glyoxylase-like metal-dependent hydrolase (beta-lactamase superfamily II)
MMRATPTMIPSVQRRSCSAATGPPSAATVSRAEVAAQFGAPLFCHENERASVAQTCPVEGTFAERHRLDDDFEVIPIPGHTSGSTAFLWGTGQHRRLLSADTLYIRDGEWIAALLGSSDREAYIASLELLRELDFDMLLRWTVGRGGPWHAMTDKADTRRRIDAIIDRLRRGDDH